MNEEEFYQENKYNILLNALLASVEVPFEGTSFLFFGGFQVSTGDFLNFGIVPPVASDVTLQRFLDYYKNIPIEQLRDLHSRVKLLKLHKKLV